jgi:NAD(P)-dependent dehydrogenase (short-subunit alcohol dehydrogenase family)
MSTDRSAAEVVVVTGTGGMGMAIARRLGTGRQVVLADFDEASLERVAAVLRGEGHDVTEVRVDVAEAESVAHLAGVASGLGPIRCVVHTAGVSPVQATPERIVHVDVIGTAQLLDAFLPHVGPGTVAVCIASMAGTMTPLPADVEHLLASTPTAELVGLAVLDPATMDSSSAYGIAKRANQVRVQAASLPWGANGGRVVSISPGIISTPMGQQELAGPSGDMMRGMIAMSASPELSSEMLSLPSWFAG